MALGFFMKRRPGSQKPAVPVQKPVAKETPVRSEASGVSYAFIDASNMFWGGRENVGFKIDYGKLLNYLKTKYSVAKAFYYGGVRIFDYDYSILDGKPLDLALLTDHLKELKKNSDENQAALIDVSLNKINFYQRLQEFGYVMRIKPAKVFYDEDDLNQERPILKANCDVDMTFDMMRYMGQYSGVVAMTGDGDFAAILGYLKNQGRSVAVLSRFERTAKEIRQIAGDSFVDFTKLKHVIEIPDRAAGHYWVKKRNSHSHKASSK
ncbi:MAG: NYN domain protein [bacterium ADurb.Bin400]|nr:MAG: NYN domain protein [bacterium ADurb.Bin400]